MIVVNFVGRPVRTRSLVSFSFTDLPERVFPFQWQRFCEDAVSLSHVLIDVGSAWRAGTVPILATSLVPAMQLLTVPPCDSAARRRGSAALAIPQASCV
jgi:hypothetical protein